MNNIKKNHAVYFLVIISVIVILLSAAIIRPYIFSVLTSILLAYIFYPAYDWLRKKIKKDNIAALLISFMVVILIFVPAVFIVYNISQEASAGYVILRQKMYSIEECSEDEFGCNLINRAKEFTQEPEIKAYVESGLSRISSQIAERSFNFVFSIARRLLEMFLIFFMLFFFLKDGKNIIRSIGKYIPMARPNKKKIFTQFREIIRAIIFGFFIIAIIEGTIGAFTFYFGKIASPILWGVMMAFLALLPIIGASIIWVPAFINQVYNRDVMSSIIILGGGLIISAIDTFIKPKIIGSKANVHPVLVLLGVLGGIEMFGLIGVIIGPLVLVMMVTLLKMYKK